jgi:hypothetical protein
MGRWGRSRVGSVLKLATYMCMVGCVVADSIYAAAAAVGNVSFNL